MGYFNLVYLHVSTKLILSNSNKYQAILTNKSSISICKIKFYVMAIFSMWLIYHAFYNPK